MWKSIESGSHTLPEDTCLPGTESPKVPHFFVGDAAFGLHKHLLRPYGGTHLTVEKNSTTDYVEQEDTLSVLLE